MQPQEGRYFLLPEKLWAKNVSRGNATLWPREKPCAALIFAPINQEKVE